MCRLFLASLAAATALLAGTASAQDVCQDAGWKRASIIRSPTPGFNPFHWTWVQWEGYITTTVAVGATVTLVLLGLIVTLQLALYIWRCARCVHFSLRRQSFHGTICPHSELTHRWLWAYKWISVVLGCGAIALCVTGMVLLPRNVVTDASNTLKPPIAYASDLLNSVDGMLTSVQSLNPIINTVLTNINDAVNIPAMNRDVQCALGLLQSVPQPVATAATLQRLDADLRTGLDHANSINQGIQAALSLPPATVSISGSAAQMESSRAQLSSYSAALAGLPTTDPGPSSSAFNTVSAAQASLQSQLPGWSTTFAGVSSALSAVQTMRNARTLATVADLSQTLYSSVQPSSPLQKEILPDALQALTALKQALSLASPALTCTTRLASAMRRINSTLVAFPPGTAAVALANFSAAEAALQQLTGYSPSAGSASLPNAAMLDRLLQSLQELPSRVQDAPDPTQFASNARAADSALQQLPDPQVLATQVTQVQSALNAVLQSSNRLASALSAYRARASKPGYSSILQAAQGARVAADNAASVLSQSQPVASAAANIVSAAQPVIDGLVGPASQQQSYVASIQTLVADYPSNVTTLVTTLNSLEPSWQAATRLQQSDDGLQSIVAWVSDAVTNALTTARTAQQRVNSAAASFGSTAQLYDILDTASRWQITLQEQGQKWWNDYSYKGWLGIYALLILLIIITFIMVLTVCPGGLVLALAACMLYLTLFLVLALGVSGGLVVGQDTCWASERLVVAEVSVPTTKTLLSYYLYSSNSTKALSGVLQEARIVDIAQVQADLDASISQVDWLVGNYTLGSALQPSAASARRILASVNSMLASTLLSAAQDPVYRQYIAVKSFACCQVANDAFVQWICMAAAGLLVILMVPVQFMVLGRLDAVPRKNCCGFQCYRAAHYQPRAVAATPDDNLSSAPDSMTGALGMTRDNYRGDTMSYPDQLSPRRAVHSPKTEVVGPLSFHYFGPPAGQKRSDASSGAAMRSSLLAAAFNDAAAPRDAIIHVQPPQNAARLGGESALGVTVPQTAAFHGSVGPGMGQQEGESSSGGSSSSAQVERTFSGNQHGNAGDMLLPPPPAISVLTSPARLTRSAVATPNAAQQPRTRSVSSFTAQQASGTTLWYGQPSAAHPSEAPRPHPPHDQGGCQ